MPGFMPGIRDLIYSHALPHHQPKARE